MKEPWIDTTEICRKCDRHCCGTFSGRGPDITMRDAKAISRKTGMRPHEFAAIEQVFEIAEWLKGISYVERDIQRWIYETQIAYKLHLKIEGGSCIFYDKKSGLCKVHSAKPFVCKCYPAFHVVLKHVDFYKACPAWKHVRDGLKEGKLEAVLRDRCDTNFAEAAASFNRLMRVYFEKYHEKAAKKGFDKVRDSVIDEAVSD
ncbi:MAG: YkgJ family cysteine cluster protein [archaeon]